ncbi:MAG: hypothetical protein R3Y47_03695 [Lachnospiraceae bacterium]
MWSRIKRGLYVPILAFLMMLGGYVIWNNKSIEYSLEREQGSTILVDLDEYFWQEEPESELVEQVLEQDAINTVETKEHIVGFLLCEEDGHVVVYDRTTQLLYLTTGIMLDSLPEQTQLEILNGKEIYDEMELFSFLETHSS